MYKKLFPLLLILCAGCVSEQTEDLPEHLKGIENLITYPENQKPTGEIELTRELSFTDTEEVFFGRLVDNIAVDDSGRVFIGEIEENTIHAFGSDGSYLQSFGRRGQGPGEFQHIRDFKIGDGAIHVLDSQRSRITLFDINTFEYVGVHDVSLQNKPDNQPQWLEFTREEQLFYRPSKLFVRPDGTYFILFYDESVGALDNLEGRTHEVSIYDGDVDEFQHDILSFDYTGQIFIYDDGNARMVIRGVPYKRSSQFDYSNGQFVHGWSDEFLFRFYDENGQHEKAIYYPYSNQDLTLDDVFTFYEGGPDMLMNAIESDEQPDTWPAFRSLVLDDENRLWISSFTDDMDTNKWRVLDDGGRLIAIFEWPGNRDLKEVKNGYAYTIELDRETGQQNVVRYKVDLDI